ncbi:hypothetical protein CCZ27_14090 [Thauera sinica]|nr:hypothetical protein CCZ27_14090 [Thauera sp. K11]
MLSDAAPARGYRDLPAPFYAHVGNALAATPGSGHDLLNLILVDLAGEFAQRFERARLPMPLLPYYRENIDRILQRAISGHAWAGSPHSDIFLKDLGILCMTLIPCASHLVFRNSGVPRSLLLRQTPRRLISALGFFGFRTSGFSPFLENHVHPAMLTHFNPAGRETCFGLVARLLECWPDSKGLIGLSWYYDPQVRRISPHLAYLHDTPAREGALFLPAGTGPDVAGDATATSRTRRALHERGEYTPTRYLMAWSRGDILERYAGAL